MKVSYTIYLTETQVHNEKNHILLDLWLIDDSSTQTDIDVQVLLYSVYLLDSLFSFFVVRSLSLHRMGQHIISFRFLPNDSKKIWILNTNIFRITI